MFLYSRSVQYYSTLGLRCVSLDCRSVLQCFLAAPCMSCIGRLPVMHVTGCLCCTALYKSVGFKGPLDWYLPVLS